MEIPNEIFFAYKEMNPLFRLNITVLSIKILLTLIFESSIIFVNQKFILR